MQCSNCNGTDFEKSVYDYYICKKCGNFNYDGSFGRKKNPLSEYYFAAILGVIVMIVVILILLFMTVINRKTKTVPVVKVPVVETEKKNSRLQ